MKTCRNCYWSVQKLFGYVCMEPHVRTMHDPIYGEPIRCLSARGEKGACKQEGYCFRAKGDPSQTTAQPYQGPVSGSMLGMTVPMMSVTLSRFLHDPTSLPTMTTKTGADGVVWVGSNKEQLK